MSDFLHFLGRLHPVVLHLPIGLLAAVAVVDVAALWTRALAVRRVGTVLLGLTAVSSLVAVGTGLLLAEGDGVTGEALAFHRWIGIVVTVAVVTALWVKVIARGAVGYLAYGLLLVASLGLMAGAGHAGGAITHGPTFVSEFAPEWLRGVLGEEPPAPEADPAPTEDRPDPLYTDVVQPALEASCYDCHGAGKVKGELRLDSRAAMLRGGATGQPAVVPGDALASLLVRRITLPQDHEDFMPSDGSPPLEPATVLQIIEWIDRGARMVIEAPDPLDVAPPPAPPEPVAALRATGALVVPVVEGSTLLRVDLAPVPESAAARIPPTLTALSDHVVELRASAATTAAVVPALASMPRLHTLRLPDCAVTDAQVREIAKLDRLTKLNLHAAAITDAALQDLATLRSLRWLVVTGTPVTAPALDQLRATLLNLDVQTYEAVVPNTDPAPKPTITTATMKPK